MPAYAPQDQGKQRPQTAPQPVAPPAPPSATTPYRAYMPYGPPEARKAYDRFSGSVYIPVDNWMYPELTRLYSMGYLDTMFLGMRPWTRRSVLHMLQGSQQAIVTSNNDEAQQILAKLLTELETEVPDGSHPRGAVYGLESSYTRLMGIGGPVLRDSYHLGQTINNDYGRPYENGFNAIAGASTVEEWGPFSLYVRGEYQHAPSATGYSNAMAAQLSTIDTIFTYAPRTIRRRPYPKALSRNRTLSDWWKLPSPRICWDMSSPWARQMHGLGRRRADRWHGPITRRISIRSGLTAWSR